MLRSRRVIARRPRRSAPYPRRPVSVPRSPRDVSSQIVSVRRTAVVARTVGALASNSQSYTFTLSYLPGYTEMTAMFDQYRIARVDMQWIPAQTSAELGGLAAANGYFVVCTDYDDNNVYAAREDALSVDNHRIFSLTERIKHTVYPRAAAAVYRSGVASGYASTMPTQWFDMATPDVPFYGVKDYVQNNTGNALAWQCLYTIHVQCRRMR